MPLKMVKIVDFISLCFIVYFAAMNTFLKRIMLAEKILKNKKQRIKTLLFKLWFPIPRYSGGMNTYRWQNKNELSKLRDCIVVRFCSSSMMFN